MKKFIVKSSYEYEIEAKDKQHAIEKWEQGIDEELATQNTTVAIEFCESLYAEEVKKE